MRFSSLNTIDKKSRIIFQEKNFSQENQIIIFCPFWLSGDTHFFNPFLNAVRK
jgi:hypothetical protein